MDPIKVGPRDLVLLAGLPGAGKSTLLAGLRAAGCQNAGCQNPDCQNPDCQNADCRKTGLRKTVRLTVRDSDQVRRLFRAVLPAWLPYRGYRPLVHALHQLRVLVATLRTPGPVLVHDPGTRAVTRDALALLAWLSGRPAVFVWLDVSAGHALEGQLARGRTIPPRSFARHAARADVLRRTLLAGVLPRGWRRVVVLDRVAMRHGLWVEVQEPTVGEAARTDKASH